MAGRFDDAIYAAANADDPRVGKRDDKWQTKSAPRGVGGMILEAFRALNAMMVRRRLKESDVEIVIRCKDHLVEQHIRSQMDEELLFDGRGFVVTDEMLKDDRRRSGTISGVRFRLEVMK